MYAAICEDNTRDCKGDRCSVKSKLNGGKEKLNASVMVTA